MKLLYGVSCLAWIFLEIWIFYREHGSVNKKTDNNTRRINVLAVFIAIGIGIIFSNVDIFAIGGPSNSRFFIGSIIIWLGLTLRFWAVQTLGKYFRTTVMIQKDHTVIESGPYKILRHPSYTGDLLAIIGVGIGMDNWIGLILMLLISLWAFHKRIVVEEQTLVQSLGCGYCDYMKRTKRLIPFIY